jgi:ABC-type multidrug transport system fused ATPase/permease subunit
VIADKGIMALLMLARTRWPAYFLSILALSIGTGLFLLLPQQLGELIQAVSKPPETLNMSQLAPIAAFIGAIFIGQAVMIAFYSYIIALVAERIGNELRATFFHNLVSRSFDVDGEKQLGAIASEFSSDLSIIQAGLSDTLISFLRHTIFTVGALIAMFVVDYWMATISLLSVAVVVLVIGVFMKLASQAVLRLQKKRSETLALLVESAANAYVIQAYRMVGYFDRRFRERLNSTYREIARNTRLMALISPVSLAVFGVAIFVILAIGLQSVAEGRMDVAGLVAFLAYAMILVVSISQLGMTLGRMRQAAAMYSKQQSMLKRDLNTVVENDENSGTVRSLIAPEFHFDKVTYRYPNAELLALDEVSFSIPRGKITAIVGESGAGKSTIVGLLSGLIVPTGGGIRSSAGGDTIALVPQNCFLFTGSISDNIRFGREWISDAQLECAAVSAQIHGHLVGLPERYNHRVEEGGANFSRGQQQRIALARALAGNPSTLVLDEATASLDVISERAIRNVLHELRGRMTVVVIAHNGEMLSDVDHLVVLDKGRIVYEGAPTHAVHVGGVVDLLPQLCRTGKVSEIMDAT